MDIPELLASKPKITLAHLPTPVENLPNIARYLGADALYVKRDDCTGLAMGGNKVRQLEYYMGDAVALGADTVLITGATQSNFVRLTAAAAAKVGMACHIQLEHRVDRDDRPYEFSGNVLLDRLLGAKFSRYPEGHDEVGADAELEKLADVVRERGGRPYIIHLAAGHVPLGALGYVEAAIELIEDICNLDLKVDQIFVGSGSGHTHAGLLFGLRGLGCRIPVIGICVRRSAEQQRERIAMRCEAIAKMLSVRSPVRRGDVIVDDCVFLPGYGKLNRQTHEAVRLAARMEGLLLDPVYTGKVFAGMFHRLSTFGICNSLFWHTGGTPALFAYETDF